MLRPAVRASVPDGGELTVRVEEDLPLPRSRNALETAPAAALDGPHPPLPTPTAARGRLPGVPLSVYDPVRDVPGVKRSLPPRRR